MGREEKIWEELGEGKEYDQDIFYEGKKSLQSVYSATSLKTYSIGYAWNRYILRVNVFNEIYFAKVEQSYSTQQ